MCLLVACFATEPGLPLVVAANRDERYDRPARPLGIVAEHPRTLAGTDEEAGGTWLAVNEHGVVAGLTNQPAPNGRDPTRRSRGELPLLAARHDAAANAVAALAATVDGAAYNPCSLLVGDALALYSVELDGSGPVRVTRVGPGRHVLENRPFGTTTPKTAAITARLAGGLPAPSGGALEAALAGLLADHRPPAGPTGTGGEVEGGRGAACVHAAGYGTRSATLVLVGSSGRRPRVLFADGPPCTAAFRDAEPLWRAPPEPG